MHRISSLKKKIRSGYALSFLLLLVSYFLIFYVQQRLGKEAEWVVHSYAVINKAESLKAALTDAETGVRGYVITQDARFLKPYNEAKQKIPSFFNELKELVSDNKEQASRLDTLNYFINRRMDFMTTGLASFQTNGFTITEEMKQRREPSLNSMDSMRLYVTKINDAEQKLMDDRKLRLSDLFSGAKLIAAISLLIIFVALLYSLITFNRENKAREKADERAEEYKVELNELKDLEKFTATGRIARTIAHEVRNPLTNILLATEQLKQTNKNDDSSMLLDLINRNASRINQLVSDLLNATRFVHLDFSKVDTNQLLDETLEMAKDRIDLKRVSVEKDYSKEKCEALVDKEKIKVALLNIIVNAIEAMDSDKGVLQLKNRCHENKCLIEIKDNGKGMDEEELQKLFDPYFTTKPKGNGLGLTNTQNIILNHKGKIAVNSKPGKGTLFLITLDLSDEDIKKNQDWGKFST